MSELDIEDILRIGNQWEELIQEAENYQLRLRLQDVVQHPDELRQAVNLLNDAAPLNSHYRSGEPAVPPFTPRQVLALCNAWQRPIDHRMKEYDQALKQVRKELGRFEPRQCSGQTSIDTQCRGWALPYNPDPHCYHHATSEAKAQNTAMKQKEDQQFKLALYFLGFSTR